jgi:dTDP-glucose 4,6-dehydratase
MKIIYVTGCLGFIPSYFVKKVLDKGWKVFGVDKQTYVANTKILKEFQKYENFKFEKVDIKDMKFLYDCDYVVNFAAESHVGNSIIDSDEFINTNILGTKNLLDLVRNKPQNCGNRPTFLHISTDEVYGDILNGSHTEQDLLHPSNPYSAAKAAADMLVLAWSRTYGIDYMIARPTNNYGIRQYPEKLIPLCVKNLMRGRKISLHNNGTPVRNWLHADDTANAIMTLIEKGNKNEIYNIAGDFEQENRETVRKIIKSFFGTDKNWEDYIDYSYSRVGQDLRYALDDSKMKSLGWKPLKSFDREIQHITNWYKENFIW